MKGRVFLVGAGPGDPELLTLKALRALKRADVIVYDRLVSHEIMELVPQGVARIDVGKRPRCHPVPQDEINSMLIRLASAGRTVVRLKGGDPFLFGRGGEEALALTDAGIPFEVVPGITSAQGVATELNVPLTHRGLASGVRYVTGHCQSDADLDYDWHGLSDPQTTLVVYMGFTNIRRISAELMAHGRDPNTPVMVVSNATRENQRHLVTSLGRVAAETTPEAVPMPALFVIGEVVSLAAILGTASHAIDVYQEMAAE